MNTQHSRWAAGGIPYLAGCLLMLAAGIAEAQIDITNGRGSNGAHVSVESSATSFDYSCIVEASEGFALTFEVRHNGQVRHLETVTVSDPPAEYDFCRRVDLSAWSLAPGDVLEFRVTVRLESDPEVCESDVLFGDVVPPQESAGAGMGLDSDDPAAAREDDL